MPPLWDHSGAPVEAVESWRSVREGGEMRARRAQVGGDMQRGLAVQKRQTSTCRLQQRCSRAANRTSKLKSEARHEIKDKIGPKRAIDGRQLGSLADDKQIAASIAGGRVERVCAGCHERIRDQYLLSACDKFWHNNCLKCYRCQVKLGEIGSTLYEKGDMNLCRRDYIEMFGQKSICSVCDKLIYASEMVMRAKQNVYHLECFACQLCGLRFCVGDRFHLCENKIVCQYDYDEHILPIQESMKLGQEQSHREPPHRSSDMMDECASYRHPPCPMELHGTVYEANSQLSACVLAEPTELRGTARSQHESRVGEVENKEHEATVNEVPQLEAKVESSARTVCPEGTE